MNEFYSPKRETAASHFKCNSCTLVLIHTLHQHNNVHVRTSRCPVRSYITASDVFSVKIVRATLYGEALLPTTPTVLLICYFVF